MQKSYVYILCNKPYGTLYIGVTSDLMKRMREHHDGIASKFTAKYGVTRLIYVEEFNSIDAAIQRETSLKRWRRDWKIDLINKVNPNWEQLNTW